MLSVTPTRILSTDFDGTIHADFGSHPIAEELQARLVQLRSDGVVWVINTGRHLSSLMESLGRAHVSVMPDYVVAVEREIYLHVDGHYEPVEPWNTRCQELHQRTFESLTSKIHTLMESLERRHEATFYGDLWSPLCVIARDNRQMDEIQVELEAFCQEARDLAVVRNDVYVRLSLQAYSKGTALREIQRLLGVSPDQTLAAGDHLNDLPMLRTEIARYLIAPSNAIPVVKAQVTTAGGFIASGPDGYGVLEGLRALGW